MFGDSVPRSLGPPPLSALCRPRADQVEAALQHQVGRIVAAESEALGYSVATLARHRNAARAAIEPRFGLELKREAVPWYELEPHALDPVWRMCVDRALGLLAGRGEMGAENLLRIIHALPKAQYAILRLARRLRRSLAAWASPPGASACDDPQR